MVMVPTHVKVATLCSHYHRNAHRNSDHVHAMLSRCDGAIQLTEEQLHEASATWDLGPGQIT